MTHYTIIGGGRLARHMHHYLSLLGIPHNGWARDSTSPLNTFADADPALRLRRATAAASHVLLLVSDSAIAEVVKRYPFLHEKTLVHCSGALSFPGLAGAHPLMTFSHSLYSLDQYRRIPFMIESGHDFKEILPGLPNPSFEIPVAQKARYHALCVMAGNFSQILWKAVSDRFADIGLPPESLTPYLERVVGNFVHDPESALTGPLSRNDRGIIQRNLDALVHDPMQQVYQSFLALYAAEKPAADLREAAL